MHKRFCADEHQSAEENPCVYYYVRRISEAVNKSYIEILEPRAIVDSSLSGDWLG